MNNLKSIDELDILISDMGTLDNVGIVLMTLNDRVKDNNSKSYYIPHPDEPTKHLLFERDHQRIRRGDIDLDLCYKGIEVVK